MNLVNWFQSLIGLSPTDDKAIRVYQAFDYSKGIATVEMPIHIGKVGLIKLYGVYWSARSCTARIIAVGENVRVLYREGLTLTVEPLDSPRQPTLSLSPCRHSCSNNIFSRHDVVVPEKLADARKAKG